MLIFLPVRDVGSDIPAIAIWAAENDSTTTPFMLAVKAYILEQLFFSSL